MNTTESYLKGKHILAVDDELDILETIEDILDEAVVDCVRDYDTAVQKIRETRYDLAILDIMGVNGMDLLVKTVERKIPTVMLTAHAISPESLMSSIQKGAISYLPKEKLAELDSLLNKLFGAYQNGAPPWKLLFEMLGDYFKERFGPAWKDKDRQFWAEFSRTYQVGKGIQERLKHEEKILDKGI